MAEILVSSILQVLVEKLSSAAFKKLDHYAQIYSEVKKWKTPLSDIQDLLNDASRKEITSEVVKSWLNQLQHLAYDIDDVLDDLATEAMHREFTTEESAGTRISKVRKLIPSCYTSFSVGISMHDKFNNITTKLQELEKNKPTILSVVINERPTNMNRDDETCLPDASNIIVGRQGDVDALLHKLLGEEPCNQKFDILPIVGMGGIGKTTLARLLYNEKQVNDHFQLKAWVCISDEFDILKISKSIFDSFTETNNNFENLNQVQVALTKLLIEKKFLLVVDDIWTESYDDWDKLVRPFHAGAPGSKIIMTTRKEQLLRKLGYHHLESLKTLSHDDALSLFCQHALGVNNFDSHPTLRPHGEQIVEKCDGLPLALRAIGRLLRTNKEWKEVVNSEIWRLQEKDGIVPALRLSYHDLSACLKQLFAYCSMFPKDYLFDKEKLIMLWMAEGFLKQSTSSTSKTEEKLGGEYFEELLWRSFFQHAPNDELLFVMHDMMNDLATSVAGDFFFRSDNKMKKDALEKYRHISFVCETYISSKKLEVFKGAKKLRTFLAVSVGVKRSWERFYLSNKVLDDLLHELPLLRVLSLSNLEISEVPESIGSLKHLRYLNLSQTKITELPKKICRLYNLQTLIVFGCHSLRKLPNNFSVLKNLRHFDIGDTPLVKEMPLGIDGLKKLQTLSKIIIGRDHGFSITELKNLENLHGVISIQGLHNVQDAMHAREANLFQKRFSELEVEWSHVFDGSRKEILEQEVLDVLKPRNDSLKKLGIAYYGGIEFPKWVGDPAFCGLTRVSIRGCKKCTSLPPLGQLASLRELFIQGMDGVKVVGLELVGSGVAFPSLEILSFQYMKGWEVWSTNGGVTDAVFPCLKELWINKCPNLVQVSLDALPSLRSLEINGCGDGVLRNLVRVASTVTKLRIKSISGLSDDVWGGVVEHLGEAEELRIEECDEIRYLWKSEEEASKVLVNLRELDVWECENLVRLGEKEKKEEDCGSNLTSLKMLSISMCTKMEHCSCPNSIERLMLYACSSITSVSLPPGGGQKLKSFLIRDCEKLLEKELFINTNMHMLEYVDISSWSNLKSIIELSCFIHLNQLYIMNCSSMESFPDHELPNLTSLKSMMILNCPSMDASFPRGLWPPNLCDLEIGGLKKPISKWGPQNFPTSLVDLSLTGECDYVSSWSQAMSDLPPSSLNRLCIERCEELESISMGFQHLTSLQDLSICGCPKMKDLPKMSLPSLLNLNIEGCPEMKDLPETLLLPSLLTLEINGCPEMKDLPKMLLPSLLSLEIQECPNLEERCKRGGSYWSIISHIPRIHIG